MISVYTDYQINSYQNIFNKGWFKLLLARTFNEMRYLDNRIRSDNGEGKLSFLSKIFIILINDFDLLVYKWMIMQKIGKVYFDQSLTKVTKLTKLTKSLRPANFF